jgi:hypothetical protein
VDALTLASHGGHTRLLRGRGMGSCWQRVLDTGPGTLDEYLKTYLKRATAGWVAVVLEHAGVVAIDRSRPARVKLNSRW